MRSILTTLLLLLTVATASAEDLPRLDEFGGAKAGDPSQPIAIVVHGINPLHDDLVPIAKDLVARGYRTFHFHYKDKQPLGRSVDQLEILALPLARKSVNVLIVAHSMGGLVARKALVMGRPHGLATLPIPIKLLTIASSFGGFASANWARLDLGLHRNAFDDLGTRSKFIKNPGKLGSNITHIKVETKEKGKTILRDGKRRKDKVVPLKSQRQEQVDREASKVVTLDKGHVSVISDDRHAISPELLAVLAKEAKPSLPPRAIPVPEPASGKGIVGAVDEAGKERKEP